MMAASTANEDLSEHQQRALFEFKSKVNDILKAQYDDYYLTKWLKARSFDVSKAEKMFRESECYKRKMKVETLTSNYTIPEVLQKYFPGGTSGFDKDGSPIAIELFGHYDMKGLMQSVRRSDMERLKLFQCEMIAGVLKQQSEKHGRRVEGITVIFDMEGSSRRLLWQPGMQMYLHLVKILEDNYPEMTKRLLVVNAPAILPLLWKIGRPLVSDDMRKKISILGSSFKEELLKYIDADQLPQYLGGNVTDPDGNPRCTSMICQGGVVPKSFYLSEISEEDLVDVVTVRSGESFQLEFDVENVGSVLRWEFRTEDCDIGFGVKFKNGNGSKDLQPIKRIKCQLVTEDDSIECDSSGKYTIIFDNSFSWMKDKKLFYRVELISTDTETEKEMAQLSDTTNF